MVGYIVLVVIFVYDDRIFLIEIKILFVFDLLKKVVNIKVGVSNLKKDKVVIIIRVQLEEVVKMKMLDLNVYDVKVVFKIIEGIVK